MHSSYKRLSGFTLTIFIYVFAIIFFPFEAIAEEKLPTITDLTKGKVKIGDLIDRNNVDLVKDYLSNSVYGLVKKGMILRMGKQIPADEFTTKAYREATERNRGKAVITDDVIVYLKDGSLWPGGMPFPDPQTGAEVMGSVKYGNGYSDLLHDPIWLFYVDKNGERYKKVGQIHRYLYTNCRTKIPPLGTIPGNEDILFKRLSVATYPIEIKGLGQYTVRYYNDAKKYDTGFVYLPAYKRTIRVSATTWQDNIGGSDLIYADGNAFQEPYSDWGFKLLKKDAYLLAPEPEAPFTYFDKKGKFDKRMIWDEGFKFARLGWAIYPVHIVEAIPKIKHLYSKRIVYVAAYPYWPTTSNLLMVDNFDRQNKLWRSYVHTYGDSYELDGETYHVTFGTMIYDLQTDHSTQMWYREYLDNNNFTPGDVTLGSLLKFSR